MVNKVKLRQRYREGQEDQLGALGLVVALYLNRRLWPFTALKSWTGSLSTGFNSWTELHLNRRHLENDGRLEHAQQMAGHESREQPNFTIEQRTELY
jgi:hypothetical protein